MFRAEAAAERLRKGAEQIIGAGLLACACEASNPEPRPPLPLRAASAPGEPSPSPPQQAAGDALPRLEGDGSVDLQTPISAAPVVGPGPAGQPVAFVGTHGGRFVAVALEPPNAGGIVLDQQLGGIVWGAAVVDPSRARVYVGADDDHLYALSTRTGEIAWKRRLGGCEPPRGRGPQGTRCDVDGVGLTPDGDVLAAADGVYRVTPEGRIRWHAPALTEAGEPRHVFGAPLWTSGMVIAGGQNGFVMGLDAATGELAWRYLVLADADGAPALGLDGRVYVGVDDGRVLALVPSTGEVAWSFPTGGEVRSPIAVGPSGRVVFGSGDGNLYGLTPRGQLAWVVPTGGRVLGRPLFDDAGAVYAGSQDGRVYAVSPAGTVPWVLELPAAIDAGLAFGPAGSLLVATRDGTLRRLRAPPVR